MPNLRWLPPLLALSLAACGPPPVADETETNTETGAGSDELGDESGTGTDTDGPSCDPELCAATCAAQQSECGEPFAGSCEPNGTCLCMQARECVPCDDEACGPWKPCTGPFGHCSSCDLPGLPFVEDSPGSCTMTLVDLPQNLAPYTVVEIDGKHVPHLDDCAEEPDATLGWVWAVEEEVLQLCEATCAEFSSGRGEVIVWVKLPCE